VKEERARLAMSANVNASGEFEVLAINAGEDNGWQFSPEALRLKAASAPGERRCGERSIPTAR
jgi:hypothetical protein